MKCQGAALRPLLRMARAMAGASSRLAMATASTPNMMAGPIQAGDVCKVAPSALPPTVPMMPPITERAAMTTILRPEVGIGSVMKLLLWLRSITCRAAKLWVTTAALGLSE